MTSRKPSPGADWRDLLASLQTPQESPDSTDKGAPQPERRAPSDRLSIFYERKGRGGKQATIITGFTCPEPELKEVASALKQRLATGGSARGGEILIQGDRRDEVATALRDMGYRVN